MVIGNYYYNIKCETFLDPETGRIRVRTLSNQIVPENILVESLKIIRNSHPVGTMFIAEEMKVCRKTSGRIYLRAKDQIVRKL